MCHALFPFPTHVLISDQAAGALAIISRKGNGFNPRHVPEELYETTPDANAHSQLSVASLSEFFGQLTGRYSKRFFSMIRKRQEQESEPQVTGSTPQYCGMLTSPDVPQHGQDRTAK